MSRVVVVGAGFGGLAAAARLSVQGHHVIVCEQADVVGGKVGWFSRDGFAFDTGPSLLTLPQAYRDLFLSTGAPLAEVVELVPLDPVVHYRFADGAEVSIPNADLDAVCAAMSDALGGEAGAQWGALMRRAAAIWHATRRDFVESPLEGPSALIRMALRRPRDVVTVAPWRSLRSLGASHLTDPRLRTLLDRYATYSGSDPRRAPAALAVVPYVEQSFRSWYVTGGLRVLAEALHQRVLDVGATVLLGADVTQVLTSSGRASGVRLADGRELPADVVVVNADATELYGRLLPSGLRTVAGARQRLAAAPRSYSGFVLLLALRGRTPGLAHHTVLFPRDYDAEFDALRAGRPVPDPTVYVCSPDDPALRPDDDHESWFVLVNAPRHGTTSDSTDWDDAAMTEQYADRVLEVMAARGLDVRDRLLWREVRTPADLERETRAPGGAIYGTSSDGPRAAFLRPRNASPVPGLFLVGGSAHPGGGLPLVTLSAGIVADLVGRA